MIFVELILVFCFCEMFGCYLYVLKEKKDWERVDGYVIERENMV